MEKRGIVSAELRRLVATTWADILQIDEPSPGDNFVDLGGHSILAVRVLFELREKLAVSLSLSQLFGSENLEEFTRRVAVAINESRSE